MITIIKKTQNKQPIPAPSIKANLISPHANPNTKTDRRHRNSSDSISLRLLSIYADIKPDLEITSPSIFGTITHTGSVPLMKCRLM